MSGGGGGGSGSARNGAAALQSQLPPLRLPSPLGGESQHALELQPILLNTPLALSDAGASGWANGGSSVHNHASSRLTNNATTTSTSSNPNDVPSSSSSTSILVLPAPPGLPNPAPAHVWRVAARNLALILTWYFFSTCLSLWNRTLLGHGHGVAGRGAFPAPMFMTAMQFCVQILMARLALWLGVERGSGRRSSGGWRGRGRPLSRLPHPASGKRRVSGAAAAAAAAAAAGDAL